MKYSLRSLMTRGKGDRLFVYGSFVALFAGLLAINATVFPNGTAKWCMVGWVCVMLAVVLIGMRLTRRPPNSPVQFSIRDLFVVVTLASVVLGVACGVWRLSHHIFVSVEREHWTQQVREGRVWNPHQSPAKYFLTPEKIDALDEEARIAGKKNGKPPNPSAPAPNPPKP